MNLSFGQSFWLVFGITSIIFLSVFSRFVWNREPAGPRRYLPLAPLQDSQLDLFHHLVSTLPGFFVLAKVSMLSLVRPASGRDTGAINKVAPLYVDYVVCKENGEPLAVIDLQPKSKAERAPSGVASVKDRALKEAGIRYFRWSIDALPNEREIQDFFFQSTDFQ